jgi:regulatory protein
MANAAAGRASRKLSLKGRALALLAQRDHSAAELRRKLLRHARAEAAIEASDAAAVDADDAASRVDSLIHWLRTQRYLSEERFVESRVHARAGRYGNLRIRQELAQHGLALSPQATQALQESELQRAAQVWSRKFGVPAPDRTQRAKQARFLAQRGFSPQVIERVLRDSGACDSGGGDG